MEYADYLRQQAERYRQLADEAAAPALQSELLELAAICERVAAEIEDRAPAG